MWKGLFSSGVRCHRLEWQSHSDLLLASSLLTLLHWPHPICWNPYGETVNTILLIETLTIAFYDHILFNSPGEDVLNLNLYLISDKWVGEKRKFLQWSNLKVTCEHDQKASHTVIDWVKCKDMFTLRCESNFIALMRNNKKNQALGNRFK